MTVVYWVGRSWPYIKVLSIDWSGYWGTKETVGPMPELRHDCWDQSAPARFRANRAKKNAAVRRQERRRKKAMERGRRS